MKKILIFLAMFLGISFFTNAQMCKIKGSTSGRTVQVIKTTWTKGQQQVVVEVSNDDALGANITVKLEVTYTATGNNNVTDTKTAVSDLTFVKAQGPTEIPIYITTDYQGVKNGHNWLFYATEVKVLSIEGNVCQ